MDLTITCGRCKSELTHVCDEKLKGALMRFLSFRLDGGLPEAAISDGKKTGMYSEGDERTSFMSEAFLYNLLGKEDARTVLALFNNVCRAVGFDPHALAQEAWKSQVAEILGPDGAMSDDDWELMREAAGNLTLVQLSKKVSQLRTNRVTKRRADKTFKFPAEETMVFQRLSVAERLMRAGLI